MHGNAKHIVHKYEFLLWIVAIIVNIDEIIAHIPSTKNIHLNHDTCSSIGKNVSKSIPILCIIFSVVLLCKFSAFEKNTGNTLIHPYKKINIERQIPPALPVRQKQKKGDFLVYRLSIYIDIMIRQLYVDK